MLLSVEGDLKGEFKAVYGISYPQPTWAEQDPILWLNALGDSIKGLIYQAGIQANQVIGIGIDAQVDGVVAVDTTGKPLRPAIIWMDRRAVSQCNAVELKFEPGKIRSITGLNPDPSHVAAKILWLAENEPEVYERAKYFLLPGSYIAYCLTGEVGVDYSNASSTMLMDINTRDWSKELCSKLDIDLKRLGSIFPATHIIGGLSSSYADRFGLNPRIPVVLGSGDEHASSLGAGVISPGLVCDIAGTAKSICTAISSPLYDATGLLETHCHADPGMWLLENPGFVSGGAYRWFCEEFAQSELLQAEKNGEDIFAILNSLASPIPIGSEGLIMLPCLMGAMTPTWNSQARGTFMGFTLAHHKGHFVRALLESFSYGLRDNTDVMMKMGLNLNEIRVVGGGAKSDLLCQIKADVTGLPVSKTQTGQTAALGAGILALVGIKEMGSITEAVQRTVRVVETFLPTLEARSMYEEYYQLYRTTYSALLPVLTCHWESAYEDIIGKRKVLLIGHGWDFLTSGIR